ncbi:MAG: nuclear transport factor 2 family protein [bacterium]
MATEDVANRLVQLCRKGKNKKAIDELYAKDIVSIEPVAGPAGGAVTEGIEGVRKKTAWWEENNEVHSAEIGKPMIGRGEFAVRMEYEVTFKPTGQRNKMVEMAHYKVKKGKIVEEQFFYHMPGA